MSPPIRPDRHVEALARPGTQAFDDQRLLLLELLVDPPAEGDTIARPEMAILWELAATYDVDFRQLLALAGYGGEEEVSARQRQRMTVALRAMSELSPADQAEALRFMAELKAQHDD